MNRALHQFVIIRNDEEVVIETEFQIQDDFVDFSSSIATIDGPLFVVDAEGNRTEFNEPLSENEKEQACNEAVSARHSHYDSEDEYYDINIDGFHDERAMSISGSGKVFW